MQRLIDQLIDACGGVWPSNDARCRIQKTLITRAEFEARKAERQNKPSWDDATEWARYLAQDSGGRWYWYDAKPVAVDEEFGVEAEVGKAFYSSRYGEVIGDWRNTVEQRPNQAHQTGDLGRSSGTVGANHIGEADEKGDVDAAVEAMKDIRTTFASQAVSQFKTSTRYVGKHPSGLSKVEVTVEPDIDFEWLANQFDDADDINAVWALRDKLHHKNKPEPSPELSFHLSNAFNELQASARLLPEDDPRRASIVSLAGGVSAVKEVA